MAVFLQSTFRAKRTLVICWPQVLRYCWAYFGLKFSADGSYASRGNQNNHCEHCGNTYSDIFSNIFSIVHTILETHYFLADRLQTLAHGPSFSKPDLGFRSALHCRRNFVSRRTVGGTPFKTTRQLLQVLLPRLCLGCGIVPSINSIESNNAVQEKLRAKSLHTASSVAAIVLVTTIAGLIL